MRIDRRAFLTATAGLAALAVAGPVAAAATRPTDWDRLRRCLGGTLVLPEDTGYATAKLSHWSRFDSTEPAAVAYAAGADDVRTCVKFAQDNHIPLVARSGGHSPAGYSTNTGLVVDVSRISHVDVGASTVTAGSGVQQVDVLSALAPHGLALSGGSCPTVGLAGFVQGGGFGYLSRGHGLGADHVVGADVVLAGGELVRCSATSEPDLFWALRGGGGGNFGIVTSFELSPVAVTTLSTFTMTWAWDQAAALLPAWAEWLANGPRELSPTLTIVLADAAPGKTPAVIVSGGWLGAPGDLAAQLDQLVSLVGTAPASRTTSSGDYAPMMMAVYGCADKTVAQCHRVDSSAEAQLPRGTYLSTRSRLFGRTPDPSGVDRLLSAFDADRRGGHSRSLSFAPLGGKINDPARTDTAYVHRDSQFLVLYGDALPAGTADPGEAAAAEAWVANGFAAMDPLSNGETYQNYPEPTLTSWRESYYAENYARLSNIKHAYDPHGFFTFPQSID
ncbi:FAD-dependent oxidoreductase [Amycolatopsis pithecellobii]|uniref:FAD-binding protein n=1 Tax=Amycolatopsis pithecellobii TaxID=664692 RepID=A0A6N7ZAT8_9PSEU|nr:FAD-dependent oxidoreductase [Amycolatopsis pithecellobii]MTD58847.1 FAD-binding protein [Amycolatopsis pithecellobii]